MGFEMQSSDAGNVNELVVEQEQVENKLTNEKPGQEMLKRKVLEVLNGEHDWLNDKEPANYDAIFQDGAEPVFLNIWNRGGERGQGYIVFHDFLLHTGAGNTFLSTEFTGPGGKMFDKAFQDGLIELVERNSGSTPYTTRWRIIGDPKANLEKMASNLANPD